MIPITFNKDDLQNEKKGTMRAQDLASMVGLVYPKKVGVLDIFDNPVLVTLGTDYLDTTGYVKLRFSKGYIVVYGRLIYVEQNEQVMFKLPEGTGAQLGNIGIRISLAESGASEVEWFMKSGTLRTDNLLNENVNGIYEMALYKYSATATAFNCDATTDKVFQIIPSVSDYVEGLIDDAQSELVLKQEYFDLSARDEAKYNKLCNIIQEKRHVHILFEYTVSGHKYYGDCIAYFEQGDNRIRLRFYRFDNNEWTVRMIDYFSNDKFTVTYFETRT